MTTFAARGQWIKLIINEKLQKEIKILVHEAEVNDSKHKNLKGKCKTLLNKHRGQSDQKKRLTSKLGAAKKVLINVDQLCRMHEKNHGLLMNYFGNDFLIFQSFIHSPTWVWLAFHKFQFEIKSCNGVKTVAFLSKVNPFL